MTNCHCGKDGHALNSVNCPVHGYYIVPKQSTELEEILRELEDSKAYRELLATKFGKKLTHNLKVKFTKAYQSGHTAGQAEGYKQGYAEGCSNPNYQDGYEQGQAAERELNNRNFKVPNKD